MHENKGEQHGRSGTYFQGLANPAPLANEVIVQLTRGGELDLIEEPASSLEPRESSALLDRPSPFWVGRENEVR
jgi:hypothetical protein